MIGGGHFSFSFFVSGMDTFRRPAQANESCEGFVGADGRCVIFVKKLPSAFG
jgi:hypothetical protein